jgi:demethylmenaquinone methyltransferase/2-methoxy-6-polyprenyl-1,4-benzoquinol methylase
MLERCRARAAAERGGAATLDCLHSDIWEWRPVRRYHAVIFGLWLSQVPKERFDGFWGLVDGALLPGGRVFCVDSANPGGSSRAGDPAERPEVERRELNDGRRFEIVKRYFDPEWLRRRLAGIGWDIEVHRTAEFILYARGGRTADQ